MKLDACPHGFYIPFQMSCISTDKMISSGNIKIAHCLRRVLFVLSSLEYIFNGK